MVLQESFEPGEALELLESERCSVYYGMANMARALLEHADRPRRRLAAMRTGLTIGLPEDIEMTMEAVGARELCNVYGSTETYGNCAVTDAHDPLALRLHTQGRPLPGMQLRVVHPVAVNETVVHTYCFRLRGAPARMFENAISFANIVNGTGSLVLTDDLEIYNRIGLGLTSEGPEWLEIGKIEVNAA